MFTYLLPIQNWGQTVTVVVKESSARFCHCTVERVRGCISIHSVLWVCLVHVLFENCVLSVVIVSINKVQVFMVTISFHYNFLSLLFILSLSFLFFLSMSWQVIMETSTQIYRQNYESVNSHIYFIYYRFLSLFIYHPKVSLLLAGLESISLLCLYPRGGVCCGCWSVAVVAGSHPVAKGDARERQKRNQRKIISSIYCLREENKYRDFKTM